LVDEVRVYVEGGGDQKETKIRLRQGFHEFFAELLVGAQGKHIRFQIIMGGPRLKAFDLFRSDVPRYLTAFCVLLVDSEGPVRTPLAECMPDPVAWRRLELPDKHCHPMVQAMEAWLLADVEALRRYYGQGFNRGAIPAGLSNVELIPKDQLVP